jgi:hypothetical protein
MSQLPKRVIYTPANANLTGFASNVTGATWTLTNTIITDGLAHQVSVRNDSATDHSAKTAILVGTDEDGKAQTETINLPAGSATVESTYYFKTLTSITPSATIGSDTMDIGWVDEFVSNTIPYNNRGGVGTIDFIVSGTINYTSQFTTNLIQKDTKPFTWKDSNDTDVVGATANQTTALEFPVMATRVKVNSYTDGATLTMFLTQHNQPLS